MKARLVNLWGFLLTTYWFIPALMIVGAIILSLVTTKLDRILEFEMLENLGYVYTGGPSGARAVFSMVGSSMINIAGVTFSITIVALVLATQQFGPRLLQNFMRDTGNQFVLGTFVSTYVYCLMLLRSIRSGEETSFVPHVSVTVAVGLAVVSLGVLIYFIHHIATSINVNNVIQAVSRDIDHAAKSIFPDNIGDDPPEDMDPEKVLADAEEEWLEVCSKVDGYIQTIDGSQLLETATKHNLVVAIELRPGMFIQPGGKLARVSPKHKVNDELLSEISKHFILGDQRTHINDVEFSIQQMVDTALRALSPGINDPNTAVTCIDFIGAGLAKLAAKKLPSKYRCDPEGNIRIVADHCSFASFVDTAFTSIRQSAGAFSVIYIRLLQAIEEVAERATSQEMLQPLLQHAQMIGSAAARNIDEEQDLQIVRGFLSRVENRFASLGESEQATGPPDRD